MDLKNPAGEYEKPAAFDANLVNRQSRQIAEFPEKLECCISGFNQDQMSTLTLPGKWTVAQVVHHLADSHMNALLRLKLALTEDNPSIKPYPEWLWAELADGINPDVGPSLEILRGIHRRFSQVLDSVDETSASRTYYHSELQRKVPVYEIPALYSWHGMHHLAHIELLKKDRGW
ncbi:MAG TPA: putative metal-dependent hydrolase [Leptospiraceae bacterium]|nr:metal-dependent hydrolase [Spirochaetaceae bacterium]HBS06004.1 putative metal-dependent hydrolase [Leptospiraceae bacterium]|tara:strand:+ start:32806 stop:33330 length:525 start_codon:yes stop_codon:yes gene_type:complete